MPENTYLILVILAMMAVTYLIRLVPLHLNPERLPKVFGQIIEYVPAAIVSSITLPALFFAKSGEPTLVNANVLSALVVLLVAWASRNLIVSVVSGVVTHVAITSLLFT